jgi:glyceraldehyde 3-phosphate dehydrogenase
MRVAINGLGRIGRQAIRQIHGIPGLELVGLNDRAASADLATLVKYDSVHGRAPFGVAYEPGRLLLGGRPVPIFQEADPQHVPFGDLGAEVVLECSGAFTRRAGAAQHLRGSVTRVVIAAPAEDADATWAPGVTGVPRDAAILSAACPATHALALLVQVLDAAFGAEFGLVTVVESYHNDQRILDLPHPDLRMARAAALSMIPAPTDAARGLAQVLPAMAGRFEAQAIRVPTPDVSLLDLSVTLTRPATLASVAEAFRQAAASLPPGLLDNLEEPLVSSDLRGSTASCILDPLLTRIMADRFIKVFAWYDNEVAYAARLRDLCLALGPRGPL